MPSRKASEIAVRFTKKVTDLNKTRARIEVAYDNHHLLLRDVESSYAGLFLQAVLAYEIAMEDLIIGLIVHPGGLASSSSGVGPRLKVRSYLHALELAAGPGKDFADWIGKDSLLAKANIFLRQGKPFTTLQPNDWLFVTKSKYIRNAIAHPSKAAVEKFANKVVGSTPLPVRERSVYGYLRGTSGATGQTRWELYAAGLNMFVNSVAA
ncbi:hypothetical protein [Rhodanobacter glycinis]|uniref:hypothetical protein n=1 Tax=Rhodanobacter glycinis TaxID=582702 RepID=UPI00112AE24F|nr:hypothetical protein [Rhodanobacter glycinis]